MKYLILVGDGMADFPLEACGGATPLAVAQTPAMDEIARRGMSGLFCPIPQGYAPGSDIGNLSLFGYDPSETFTGRAPLEAANQGIELGADRVAFRCNLVTLDDTTMVDFTAGHISSDEARELIAALDGALGDGSTRFHSGVSYRHLMTVQAIGTSLSALVNLRCTPPHDIIGREYAAHLPVGEGRDWVVDLMCRSREVLREHPVNGARVRAGRPPATSIWLWGQGKGPSMPTYRERFGITGAVISAVDLVNGIGRLAGLEVVRVPGATGYLDTNYEGKVGAALGALNRHEFVYLHVEAPDETSHEGRVDLKIQAIEDFDRRVVGPCLDEALRRDDCRILVAPDHVTSIASRTHAQGPVPFALCGPGIEADERDRYSEAEAAKSGIIYPDGHRLVPDIIVASRLGTRRKAAAG